MHWFKKYKIKIIILITFIFIVFIIPICINESYKHNVGYKTLWDASEVLSYYGSIIGGIFVFCSLYITIWHERKLQSEQRHENVKPFIKAWHFTGADPKEIYQSYSNYDYVYNWEKDIFEKKVRFSINDKWFLRTLIIKNIGHGIASSITLKIKRLSCNKTIRIDDTLYLGESEGEIYNFKIMKKFLIAGDYQMTLEFTDVYKRKYMQTIDFSLVYDNDINDINLNNFLIISPPQILQDL